MADDLILVLGDTQRISYVVSADEEFALTSGSVSVFDEDGTAVVSGAAASADPAFGEEAQEHTVYYLWTPSTAGDYTYLLRYVVAGETVSQRGSALVWPEWSKMDRYIERIQARIQETEVGSAQQMLGLKDYRNALLLAVRDYSVNHPREVRQDVILSADDWTYPLSGLAVDADPAAEWAYGFSEITGVDYPNDDSVQALSPLDPHGFVVDERAETWRFVCRTPAAGEVARVTWTTVHTLSHTVDTLLPRDFEAVCLYAAAQTLEMMANKAAQTNDPDIAAQVVSYRDISQRLTTQADRHVKTASRLSKRRVEFYL